MKDFMIPFFLTTFCSLAVLVDGEKLVFNEGSFKILHLSDVHFRPDSAQSTDPQETACRDVDEGAPCTLYNTTDFITRLLETEKPDLVVHTGDVIDGNSHSAADAMDILYGLSIKTGTKWAASLGNHDDDSDLSRPEVMQYIVGMENTLSQMNALGDDDPSTESYGNYYLEIYRDASEEQPAFRTFHLDSNTNDESVNAEQVEWLSNMTASLSPTPALLFTHLPIVEYYKVLTQKEGVCGSVGEHVSISRDGANGLFEAMEDGASIKAMFVGHDHTNDYCGLYKGIQLCYEGSPGYQGYGHCNAIRREMCYNRRARVTEIKDNGKVVTSYKRVDTWPSTRVVDEQILWQQEEEGSGASKHYDDGCVKTHLQSEELESLEEKKQPIFRRPE